jgi:hypothetical protein
VYKFETIIGFMGGVQLCAEVEQAYKNKTSIYDAVFKVLEKLYLDRYGTLDFVANAPVKK